MPPCSRDEDVPGWKTLRSIPLVITATCSIGTRWLRARNAATSRELATYPSVHPRSARSIFRAVEGRRSSTLRSETTTAGRGRRLRATIRANALAPHSDEWTTSAPSIARRSQVNRRGSQSGPANCTTGTPASATSCVSGSPARSTASLASQNRPCATLSISASCRWVPCPGIRPITCTARSIGDQTPRAIDGRSHDIAQEPIQLVHLSRAGQLDRRLARKSGIEPVAFTSSHRCSWRAMIVGTLNRRDRAHARERDVRRRRRRGPGRAPAGERPHTRRASPGGVARPGHPSGSGGGHRRPVEPAAIRVRGSGLVHSPGRRPPLGPRSPRRR